MKLTEKELQDQTNAETALIIVGLLTQSKIPVTHYSVARAAYWLTATINQKVKNERYYKIIGEQVKHERQLVLGALLEAQLGNHGRSRKPKSKKTDGPKRKKSR